MKKIILGALERGYFPLSIERGLVRALIKERNKNLCSLGLEKSQLTHMDFISKLHQNPIALVPDKANQQHYEVAADFFRLSLGKHLKYSSCLWEEGCPSLDRAEAAMLELYCKRAEILDEMNILELGCGWGSLSLWLAEQYPTSNITSVSNSQTQKIFIDSEAKKRGLTNLKIITSDMNNFSIETKFDRIVSIEMFEHMRNWPILLDRISKWLLPNGKLFIHIFCHKDTPYLFETEGLQNWMGRYFFSGGMMPASSTLLYLQEKLLVEKHWRVSGIHYQKTAQAWRENLESYEKEARPIFSKTYGAGQENIWYNRWRLFFMACEMLFGFNNGSEWFVSHYLLKLRT